MSEWLERIVSNHLSSVEQESLLARAEQAEALASLHMWRICAQSSVSDAYAYAVNTEVPNPGRDEAVITDAVLLAAVQTVLGQG